MSPKSSHQKVVFFVFFVCFGEFLWSGSNHKELLLVFFGLGIGFCEVQRPI